MNIRLLYCLLLTFKVSGIYAYEMPSVGKSLCHSNKTDSRFLNHKTGFDKSCFKFNELFSALTSNNIKQYSLS